MNFIPKYEIYLLYAVILLYIFLLYDILLPRNCKLYDKGKSKPTLIERESFAADFAKYLKMFNKSYDAEETKWRFQIFKKNVKEINRLNKLDGAKYEWTKFTDVRREEFLMSGLGLEHSRNGNLNNGHTLLKNINGHGMNRQMHLKNIHGHKNNRLMHQKIRHGHKKNRQMFRKYKRGHKKDRPIVYQQHKWVCKPKFNSIEYCPNDLQDIYKDRKIPDKVDWREKGKVGPVLNQKLCNGCWAFSIVGIMESMAAIQGIESDVVSLSIQELLDCRAYQTGSGCNYGSVYKHLRYMCNNNISVVKDTEYPLTLFEETCLLDGNPPGRQLGCFNYNTNIDETDILRLLAFHGPVITVVNADPWLYYLDGVISDSCYRSVNEDTKLHVVQIVGYDTAPTYPDLPYYIVRNSWGEDFGIDGYVKLAMYKNICGIADEIYYLMVD